MSPGSPHTSTTTSTIATTTSRGYPKNDGLLNGINSVCLSWGVFHRCSLRWVVMKSRLGQNALERGFILAGCARSVLNRSRGFDLHDDHVLPIGVRAADEGLVLVRVDAGI